MSEEVAVTQKRGVSYKTPGPDPTAEHPLSGDLLSRGPAVESMATLLCSLDGSFVLAITGRWGTGKTTFLTMLRSALEQRGAKSVYFNAWANDFAADPLVPLLSELEASLSEFLPTDTKGEILKKLKSVGVKALKGTLPIALRYATSGLINVSGGEATNFLEGDMGKVAEEIAKKELASYLVTKNSLEEFRTTLGEVVERAASEASTTSPIVIVIDELDRCRPTFAIELLERVKHLFEIPGIVFVLAMDPVQMEAAVRGVYGEGVDADGYLRRFIDLKFQLPKPEFDQLARQQWRSLGLDGIVGVSSTARDAILVGLVSAGDAYEVSARVLEQCLLEIAVVIRSSGEVAWLAPSALGHLVMLRAVLPDLYERIVSRLVRTNEVVTAIGGRSPGSGYLESLSGTVFRAHILNWLEGDVSIADAGEEWGSEVVGYLQSVRKGATDHNIADGARELAYLAEKLDLSAGFAR